MQQVISIKRFFPDYGMIFQTIGQRENLVKPKVVFSIIGFKYQKKQEENCVILNKRLMKIILQFVRC